MQKSVLTWVALALLAALPLTSPGGIPVIDYSNLLQNTTTALKQVAAYAQQVQQYQLQLQQYANQVRNTVAPVAQVWQAAQSTMNSVMGTVNMFQGGQSQLQGYLNQFQNVNYWLSASPNSYSYQTAGSIAQKQANDAMVKGIVAQQAQIRADAATLERLQSQASTADGQMKALYAANQLAALQQEQLLQIRELLVQEQQALAARGQTLANDEAMREAATKNFYQTPQINVSAESWNP
jgi:P-type conjugative transfer protein TrbJ